MVYDRDSEIYLHLAIVNEDLDYIRNNLYPSDINEALQTSIDNDLFDNIKCIYNEFIFGKYKNQDLFLNPINYDKSKYASYIQCFIYEGYYNFDIGMECALNNNDDVMINYFIQKDYIFNWNYLFLINLEKVELIIKLMKKNNYEYYFNWNHALKTVKNNIELYNFILENYNNDNEYLELYKIK